MRFPGLLARSRTRRLVSWEFLEGRKFPIRQQRVRVLSCAARESGQAGEAESLREVRAAENRPQQVAAGAGCYVRRGGGSEAGLGSTCGIVNPISLATLLSAFQVSE